MPACATVMPCRRNARNMRLFLATRRGPCPRALVIGADSIATFCVALVEAARAAALPFAQARRDEGVSSAGTLDARQVRNCADLDLVFQGIRTACRELDCLIRLRNWPRLSL